MRDQGTSIESRRPLPPRKKPYTTPRLTRHGTVAQLTEGGAKPKTEPQGSNPIS